MAMRMPRILASYTSFGVIAHWNFPCLRYKMMNTNAPANLGIGHQNARNLGILNKSERNNVPLSVAEKVGLNLHLREHHPLGIIKSRIEKYFMESPSLSEPFPKFKIYDDLPPVVTTWENFDSLLIPKDHVSRRSSDTYYVDGDRVLRTHTSAHQVALLKDGPASQAFLVCGDVYRRDEVDKCHYPIFHQMEGVRIFSSNELSNFKHGSEREAFVVSDLRSGLEGLTRVLFGDVKMRWVDAYFPFTSPSFELEIFFGGKWLEVLGCGLIERGVLQAAHVDENAVGWAFGLGLERLAMVLFSIPDIRLFWTSDPRFTSQFKKGEIAIFKPYSKYPPCSKDVSFWLTDANEFHDNDLYELVRNVAGDLIEEIFLVDTFEHPKTRRISKCYRLLYRSMDRSLTNEEVDSLQEIVRQQIVSDLGLEIR